ncbi:FecCD family ABC transporter permease [Domibacillus mangrovi]|uniref:ABC transporter permease n=1 Tax=Domibacillus mangrovi TaxID=1714354 RepID=A0A1Q5P1E5_9BACI|nr:iron ABC transporter permease [Domibacillus mangrovi]OKL36085.1 ABC transporter permease [Domibacillus mangrovi]
MSRFTIRKQKPKTFLLSLFAVIFIFIVIGFFISLKWGQATISWRILYEAITYQGQDKEHLYIQTLRMPRTITAFVIGVHMALAGLLTQLVTRNPIASPHIFGINAGASLSVVISLIVFPSFTLTASVYFAFIGAILGALLVFSLAGIQQKQHVRLALAGIAVHFLLSSLTEGLIIMNQHSTDSMMFWLVGAVNQAGWQEVQTLLPWSITGITIFLFMLPSFRLLLIDDDVALSLGQRIMFVKLIGMLIVILLAGSAVATCGPIGFVGLLIPHVARLLAGEKLGTLVPLTGLLGGLLLVYADFFSRFIAYPYESPVGILTAVIGGPFFIYLARKKGRASL